jgi:hypothetical protein
VGDRRPRSTRRGLRGRSVSSRSWTPPPPRRTPPWR